MKTAEQKQHLLDIADAIENEPQRFDMKVYYSTDESAFCQSVEQAMNHYGTTMCIAGWSGHIAKDYYNFGINGAASRMGLSYEDANRLCLSPGMATAENMPEHLRAKGMSDAVRQIANDAPVEAALDDVAERYI